MNDITFITHSPRSIMLTVTQGDVVTTNLDIMLNLFACLEAKGNQVINQFIGKGHIKLMSRGKRGLLIGVSHDIGGDDFYGFAPTRIHTITYYPYVGDTGKTEGEIESDLMWAQIEKEQSSERL